MKILLIIPSFYPAFVYGGPIFSTLYTLEELTIDDEVHIKVCTTNANMNSKLNLPANRWLNVKGFPVKYYNESVVGKFSLFLFFNIWKEIKEAKVIHIQSMFNTPTPISMMYSFIFKKPVLLSPRGALGKWCLSNGSKLKKLWLKILIKPFLKNTTWHATSEQEKNEILAIFPKAKVQIIPNGIKFSEYQMIKEKKVDLYTRLTKSIILEEDKVIVSMGRIQKKKGFDILIRSFIAVLTVYPSAKLLIAGDDEGELSYLNELVEDKALMESVFFVGSVSNQEKVDFLSHADVFALPSHNENFGNVYLESLAAGTPILASKNTPWADVETFGSGLWVENTVKSTSDALLNLLLRNRDEMRINSKVHAKKYGWDQVAIQFKKVYQAMAN